MDSDGLTLTGVPAEYEPLVTLFIAWVSAWLVQPLTALTKKWGGTRGPSTVAVSAMLSLLVSVGFSAAASRATGGLNLWQVLGSAGLAFLRANGNYVNDVFVGRKAARAGPPPESPPEQMPGPDSDDPHPVVRVLE